MSQPRRPPALWSSAAVRTGPRSKRGRFPSPLAIPRPGTVRKSGWLVSEQVVPAVPLSVGRLRRALDRELAGFRIDAMRRADVALLVSEVASDAVVHAYPGTEPGPLYLVAGRSGRDLVVTICDWGPGVRTTDESTSLGRRLWFLEDLADAVAVSPNASGVGIRVAATFRDLIPDELPED